MRPVELITDRAKRYRAHQNPPPGPRRCAFCASEKNIDIDHIGGSEDDGDPANLMYLCRSCNTRKGNTQARHGIGKRTRQFNPQLSRVTFKRYVDAALTLRGDIRGDLAEAAAIMRATSARQREKFTGMIRQAGKKNPEPTYAQYCYAVSIHKKGARDEGGEIIHATSPAKRSEYARKIAETKRRKGSSSAVPF